VRGLATAALVASVAVPLLRRRHRIPAAATVAATAAGPFALAVLFPRTKTRDAALFAMQMWGFTMAHELPYDDPEALRRRLRVRYPITADRILGMGELPSVRLQRALSRPGAEVTVLDRALSIVHWSWFIEPHLALVYILARREEHFARSARQMAAAYDLGCFVYYALPTAPPWWSSEEGEIDAPLRRIMVDVGEQTWGRAWPVLYDSLGGNPWAAMPSLHFATSVMAAILLAETGPVAGAIGWTYAGALGFALVYLAEHYVIDLVAGATLVALVRRGEPLAEPLALAISRVAQRLERVAGS
jgi:membrane-associated phospholipid phosphatase